MREHAVIAAEIALSEPTNIQLDLGDEPGESGAGKCDSVAAVSGEELVRPEAATGERNLYRKNLKPVTYVTADVAGAVESPAYAQFAINREIGA